MRKFLRSFQDQAAYEVAKLREDFYKPCVSLIGGSSLQYDPLATVPEGFVDFGLPSGTLWSTKNIGATNGNTAESWYGNYYAWGETEAKSDYSWSNYAFGAASPFSKYDTDSKTVLEAVDDIATITNSVWRMPTKEDFDELLAGTTNSWVEDYNNIEGLNGRVFTKAMITPAFKNITLYSPMVEGEVTDEMWAPISGLTLEEVNAMIGGDIRTMMFKNAEMNIPAVYDTDYGFVVKQTDSSISMFIPAAGFRSDVIRYVGVECSLWSSSLFLDSPSSAYYLDFSSVGIEKENPYNHRYTGFTVRPVLSVS